jgi:hypothetical protein
VFQGSKGLELEQVEEVMVSESGYVAVIILDPDQREQGQLL